MTIPWEDRCVAVPLLLYEHRWAWCLDVYIPTSCSSSYRLEIYSKLNDLRHRCRSLHPGAELLGGDWNGHVGRDTPGNDVQIGSEKMKQATTEGGKALLRWISTSNLINSDSFFKILNRGTWHHAHRGWWYELDKFALSADLHKATVGIDTKHWGISDHMSRHLYMKLPQPETRQKRSQRKAFYEHRQRR